MTPKVLLVGWDGVRYDTVRRLIRDRELPNLQSIADDGFIAATEMPDTSVARTETAPGWCTILTGVWPTKHLVTANTRMPTALDQYPDVLSRAEAAAPRRRTMATLGAAMIAGDFGPGPLLGSGISELNFHDRRLLEEAIFEADRRVLADATTALIERDAQLSFVYFGIADKTAHRHGTLTEEYATALRTLDERLGSLLAAIQSRATVEDEDWLVIVTTDHGHRDEGGHGGNTAVERQSFVAVRGLDGDISGLAGRLPSDIGNGPAAELDDGPSDGSREEHAGLDDGLGREVDSHNDENSGHLDEKGRPLESVDIAPTMLSHVGIEIDPAWDLDGRPLQERLSPARQDPDRS